MGRWKNGNWVWEWNWCRPLCARNLSLFENLIVSLSRYKFSQLEEDTWRWIHNNNGYYCTKIAYNILRQSATGVVTRTPASEAFKKIWKAWTPKKQIMLAWRLLRERFLTKDNLQKKRGSCKGKDMLR
ncbi:hypothetical protein ACS0TY_014148 [Phlomoides rotata]